MSQNRKFLSFFQTSWSIIEHSTTTKRKFKHVIEYYGNYKEETANDAIHKHNDVISKEVGRENDGPFTRTTTVKLIDNCFKAEKSEVWLAEYHESTDRGLIDVNQTNSKNNNLSRC